MNLAIDIGNTRAKAGVFDKGELIHQEILESGGIDQLLSSYTITSVALCSVRRDDPPFVDKLSELFPVLRVAHNSRLPFTTTYETPETLGTDRIAALAAVATIHPGTDVLVIDAGSCITYDFIDNNAVHHGGAISPGIQMRFKALSEYTGRLPLVSISEHPEVTGSSTEGSIASGVLNGVIEEVEGIISRYASNHQGLKTVLTGGDVSFLEANLKTQIFAAPNLVLQGLNSILEFNEVSR